MSAIDDLMHGAIDMHLHFGPEANMSRRVDALSVATTARDLGLRALVLKSREYPTSAIAELVNKVVSGITVLGSVTLDWEVGGLNPLAAEVAGAIGARVLWMPTFSTANFRRVRGGGDGGITVLDDRGKLLPVIGEILDVVKKYDLVLATGHLSLREVYALVGEARRQGISKIVVTHPIHIGSSNPSPAEQKELASMGAYMEMCCATAMPSIQRFTIAELLESYRAVGAERCIMATDLGQDFNPPPAEGLRMFIAGALRGGVPARDIEIMVKENPAKLLGLD